MMRGKHVTKPIEMVVEEARELADDGVRELILVAQDTTYYGLDLYGEVRLVELLEQLEHVEGIDWIRLMYLYPIHFTDRSTRREPPSITLRASFEAVCATRSISSACPSSASATTPH
jgi:tRNA A37 methylthiotransferase MiaB